MSPGRKSIQNILRAASNSYGYSLINVIRQRKKIFFPSYGEGGNSQEGGPVGVMLLEHKQGRQYVKAMGEGIARYAKGDRKAALKIVENARNYMALVSQHIDKEDNIFYPMADVRIPGANQKELEEGFENIETKIIGPGRHEEFHRLLQSLREEYLKE